jgi:hypothetical protein
MEISIPPCLFIGAMLLLLGLGFLWFERGSPNYSARQQFRREMRRFQPRLSPKVEDDERRLKNLERPDDSPQPEEWEVKQKRDFQR